MPYQKNKRDWLIEKVKSFNDEKKLEIENEEKEENCCKKYTNLFLTKINIFKRLTFITYNLFRFFYKVIYFYFLPYAVVPYTFMTYNLNATTPSANFTAPAFNITVPAFNFTAPAFNITTPASNITAPAANITAPAFNITAPAFIITVPEFNITKPADKL
jgi:hypothetical protein